MGTQLQQDVFCLFCSKMSNIDLHDNYDAMQYISMAKNCLFWLLDTQIICYKSVSHYYTVRDIIE